MKKIVSQILYEIPFFIIIFTLLIVGTITSRIYLTIPSLFKSFATVFIYTYIATTIVYITKSKAIKQFFYLTSFLLCMVDMYLHIQFGTRISPNIILLLSETNSRESIEFIQTYLLSTRAIVILTVFCVGMGATYFLEKHRLSYLQKSSSNIANILVLFFLIFGGYCVYIHYYRLFQCQDTTEVDVWMKKYEMRAMDNLSNLTYSLFDMSLMKKEQEKALHYALNDIDGMVDAHDSLNVVFVIGESHNKWHSSLYGYPLNTNPLLNKELANKRLFLFQDAIAPYNLTSKVLRNLFNTNCLGTNEKWLNGAFFPAIFRHAGFDVDFWDNQYETTSRNSFDFSLNTYLHNPRIESAVYSNTNTNSFKLDEELLHDYFNNINNKGSVHRLIILHLMGQHFAYYTRFPHGKGFDYFTSDSITRKDDKLTKKMRQIIADYDNATRYIDFILYNIIEQYKNTNSVVVYLSDHGEDIFDYQTEIGRSLEKEVSLPVIHHQFKIPFFIWCSDIYKERHKDIISNIETALQRPFSSDNICHLLFHLASIKTKYYKPERDVINSAYKCPTRVINDIIDYDQVQRSDLSLLPISN